jgi:DNA-directed RNA polymerase subunit RPC12/RpoP
MISFQCPACQKVLKVAGHSAGKTAPCPNCGQRLLVTPPIKAAQPAARPFPAPDLTDAAGGGSGDVGRPRKSYAFGCFVACFTVRFAGGRSDPVAGRVSHPLIRSRLCAAHYEACSSKRARIFAN